jgi:F-type H+-transporting ATPase subunit b
MNLDPTTLLFEIINFMILVAILKRWFYKPIQEVISARQKESHEQLTLAEKSHQEALDLRSRYEGRLRDWELERKTARVELGREIEKEKQELTRVMRRDLTREIEKERAVHQRDRASSLRTMEEEAMSQARRFLTTILARLSRPATESLLLDFACQEFQRCPDLLNDLRDGHVVATSAFPLTQAHQESLQSLLGTDTEFLVDPRLLAGIELGAEGHRVTLNLRDELQLFEDATRSGG